jgi:hypothetical protein
VRCRDLELLRDLADAQKHGGQLSRSSVRVAGVSGSGGLGGLLQEFGPLGMIEHSPKMHITGRHHRRRDPRLPFGSPKESPRVLASRDWLNVFVTRAPLAMIDPFTQNPAFAKTSA